MTASFDNVRHDRLLAKVAHRVDDPDVMHLLKIMLKANGRCGVPLRANDGETSESLKFSLEGVGQPSHGHAKQRIENEWSRWR